MHTSLLELGVHLKKLQIPDAKSRRCEAYFTYDELRLGEGNAGFGTF